MASPKLDGPGEGLLVGTGPVGLGGLPGSVYAGRPPSLRYGRKASGAGGLGDIFDPPEGDEIPGSIPGGDIGDNVGLLMREMQNPFKGVLFP